VLRLKKLDLTLLYNHLYIEVFAALLVILSVFHVWIFLLLISYLFILRKQINWMRLVVLFSLLLIIFYISYDDVDHILGEVKVVDIEQRDTYERITVKKGLKKFHIYNYNKSYELGDVYYIDAHVKQYEKETNPFDFNFYMYFKSKGVFGILDINDISYIKNQNHIYTYRYMVLKQVDQEFIKSLIFGQSIDDEIIDVMSNLDLLFVLNISGIHIYFLIKLLKRLLFDFNVCEYIQHIIILLFYSVILYFSKMDISIIRLVCIYLIYLFENHLRIRISSLDKHMLAFVMTLMTNIYLVYSLSFFMMFIIVIMINLTSYMYQNLSPIVKKYAMSLLVWLILLPFQNHISLLYIFISPIIIYVVSIIIYPLTWLAFLSPPFIPLLKGVVNVFYKVISLIETYQIIWWFHHLNSFYIGVSYLCIILFLLTNKTIKKYLYMLLVLIIIFLPSIQFNIGNEDVFYMIDVGQGDGMYIKSGSEHIVVDAFEHTTTFLKNHGVNHIDYLILTHSDYDHMKEAQEIIDTFKVKQVIVNAFDDGYDIYRASVKQFQAGDMIHLEEKQIKFLGPIQKYQSRNDNSLVFKMQIGNLNFLFTGVTIFQIQKLLIY